MTMQAEWKAGLLTAANRLKVDLTDTQAQQLTLYLEQLQRWNRTYNLTAIRDPEQMLVQHLFDSLSVIDPLGTTLYKNTVSPTILDVGSGAGLPGVVLAIAWPDVTVHCVDTVEKKATFIRYVSGVLGLSNLHAHHARIEALPDFEADIVISRAFASLLDFATLAGRHVRDHGWLVAMKGRTPNEEIESLEAQSTWRVNNVMPLEVPELEAQRCLIWMNEQGTV